MKNQHSVHGVAQLLGLARWPWVLLTATLLGGCSDDPAKSVGGGEFACLANTTGHIDCLAVAEVRQTNTSQLVKQGAVTEAQVGAMAIAELRSFDYTIRNLAPSYSAAALQIERVQWDYVPASPAEKAATMALSCTGPDGKTPCAQMDGKWRTVVPSGGTLQAGQVNTETLKINVLRLDDKPREAKLTIFFRGVDPALRTLSFTVRTKLGPPMALFQSTEPSDLAGSVAFAQVPPGQVAQREVRLLNVGGSTLTVTGIQLGNVDATFALALHGTAGPDGQPHPGGGLWKFAAPLQVLPGGFAALDLTFSPKDATKRQGVASIRTTSNDGSAQDLALAGNTAAPCIYLKPNKILDFGSVKVGKVSAQLPVSICNCGAVALSVSSVAFVAGNGLGEFSIDQSGLAAKLGAPPPISAANPLPIAVNGCEQVTVQYVPQASPLPDAPPQPSTATLKVLSNAFSKPELTLKGIGYTGTCAEAVVVVKEGEQVAPQTPLHLVGDKSTAAAGGPVAKYLWQAVQPAGSNEAFFPNNQWPNPTFTPNVVGEYQFCLTVWDQDGEPGCTQVCQTVLVVPDKAVHVELLWNTPSDADQSDKGIGAGADLDLHFAHQLAVAPDLDCDGAADPWFTSPWDDFWFNPTPQWGSGSSDKDDPTLDLDDTDGMGPENLNLAEPEGDDANPVIYSVGVHYWDDHGFGKSFATVSIFLQGAMIVQLSNIGMMPLDMWYVGKLRWPNSAVGGKGKIFETCYQSDFSCKVGKNMMWKPSGQVCLTHCYMPTTLGTDIVPVECKP